MPEYLDLDRLITIFHLFGVVIGAGGAFLSDAVFLTSIKDGTISSTEMRFIKLSSRFVWGGLSLLIISGVLLFALSPEEYLHSTKFLAKMSVVAVIFINGIFFHISHIPVLGRTLDVPLSYSSEFRRRANLIMASGAISLTSWIFAIVLGRLRSLPFSYSEIIGVYVLVILFAIGSALILKKKLLHL